jgi:outer membrane protein assembly factor BamE (lipoprotein component of BamABCDE complex)
MLRVGKGMSVLTRFAAAAGLAISLAGCLGYNGTLRRGYVIEDTLLDQVKPGMPAEKVLDVLGDPSTTSTVGGGAWYYISQLVSQSFQFSKPQVTDQRVVAVYFDNSKKVVRIANYGLQDGKVFDFISRTTPTTGKDQSFVGNLFRSITNF